MALQKDSVIIELLAAEDGYFVRAWRWDQSPPPLESGSFIAEMDRSDPAATFRTDRVSSTKTELKNERTSRNCIQRGTTPFRTNIQRHLAACGLAIYKRIRSQGIQI